jgi:phosphopentomutase
MPDAADYGDLGANTIRNIDLAIAGHSSGGHPDGLELPYLGKLGLGNIVSMFGTPPVKTPRFSFGKAAQLSAGKDSTVGHWEHFGIITKKPFPTYPDGFPPEIIAEFEHRTGRKAIGNKPASGTEIIKELGEEQMKSGSLIVYTSADSVFQVASHRKIVPIDELYRCCKIAREIMTGDHGVSRVIARPFDGVPGEFYRTEERHDFSLAPSTKTGLDILRESGRDVIGIGKIADLFAGQGITRSIPTKNNADGIDRLIEVLSSDFNGLVYINLVDFDMLWGHRNDYMGFADGLRYFDSRLEEIIRQLRDSDLFIISADHGCDPTTPSTDHSREYIPILAGIYPFNQQGSPLGTRRSFADIGATVLKFHGLVQPSGNSFLRDLA